VTETRTVTCTRCGDVAPGLSQAPLAGAVGQLVFDNVCQVCWADWFEQSVNVINHYGLNPALREHREQLYEVMKEFFNLAK
jgi:Fe-S cluster biosynthesis and repair protein YggX